MSMGEAVCSKCGDVFPRENKKINEAKKLGLNQYCSHDCYVSNNQTGEQVTCCNKNCNKQFYMLPSRKAKSKSGDVFCSSSCGGGRHTLGVPRTEQQKAHLSLVQYQRTHPDATEVPKAECPNCHRMFKKEHPRFVCCSRVCAAELKTGQKQSTADEVLTFIREHHANQGTVPTNRDDRNAARGADRHFGSWNQAVTMAGFTPNTEWMQKKNLPCLDGHKADSISEKLVDDWFHLQGIKHERRKRYPDSRRNCDFYLPDTEQWVEYLGLSGAHIGYDATTTSKREIAVAHNLNLIEIVPSMLYPVNTLHLLFEGTSAPTEKVCVFASSKEELQVLVDTMPIEHIAKKFHISHSAVSAECVKLGVSKPPRGHWIKKSSKLVP